MSEHDRKTTARTSPDAVDRAVRVRLFSVLREKVGSASVDVAVEEPISGAELLDRLAEAHPPIAAYRSVLRLAVEKEYVPETATVPPGADAALITPVSGG